MCGASSRERKLKELPGLLSSSLPEETMALERLGVVSEEPTGALLLVAWK